jgi:malonate-semialdehyde dehydrogenase (acetylating)/methylmalonate-semialdehyde dehydrogenase
LLPTITKIINMIRLARPSTLRLPLLSRAYAQAAPAQPKGQSNNPKNGLSPLAQAAAEEVSTKWKGTSATGGKTMNYIGGKFTESKAEKWLEVRDPVSHFV